jgi:hypothetical protein
LRRGILAGFALAALLPFGRAVAQGSPLEYAVKATYLYKFGPFIEWPDVAAKTSFDICIVGRDPFGELLDEAVKGQRLRSNPIAVRRLQSVAHAGDCQVVFAGGSEAESVAGILAALRGSPVLTVTDAAIDEDAKGIVHFVLRDNRVRFEIDEHAASENGLAVSSKVLSLAVAVRPRL